MNALRRGRLIVLAFVVAVGGMLALVVRDLTTLETTVRKVAGVSETLTLENVHVRKTISGDFWEIRAPLIERSGTRAAAYSLDVRVRRATKEVLLFSAKEGVFDENAGEILLRAIRGEGSGDVYRISLDAPIGRWCISDDEGVFTEGITLSADEIFVRAARGVLRGNGTWELSGGTMVEWTQNAFPR